MKKCILIASHLLLLSCLSYAQNVPAAEIDSIHFPYRKGYTMKFVGESSIYNIFLSSDDAILSTLSSTRLWHIGEQLLTNNDTIVQFRYSSLSGEDTLNSDASTFLYIDSTGMHYFYSDEADAVKYKFSDKQKDSKRLSRIDVKALPLPLKQGMTWKTHSWGAGTQFYTCTTVDTLIQTGLGTLHAFATKHTGILGKNHGVIRYYVHYDYYAQGVGKIGYLHEVYITDEYGVHTQIISRESYTLESVWWSEK